MANIPSKAQSNTLRIRRGRPKKNSEQSKAGYLGFRLPEEELKAIETAALTAGESVSEYVRKAIASRMEERRPLIPSTSLSYDISPVKIVDNKLASLEGTSMSLPTQVKTLGVRFCLALAEDDSSQKES